MKFIKVMLIVFWGVMMCMLLKEKFFFHEKGHIRQFSLKKGDYWIGILYKGERAGFFHIVNDLSSVRLDGEIHLNLIGKKSLLKLNSTSLLKPDGKIKSFFLKAACGNYNFTANGIEDHGGLLVKFSGDGNSQTQVRIARNISIRDVLVPDLRIKHGERRKLKIYNPVTGTQETAFIKVERSDFFQNSKVKIINMDCGGSTSKLWVTEDGEILKAETPFGFTLVREKKEDAVCIRDVPEGKLVDILSDVAVDAGKVIENPASLKKMVIRLEGIKLEDFTISSERQKVLGSGLVEISRAAVPEGEVKFPVDYDRFRKFLSPAFLIDSGDNRIMSEARKIIGEEADLWEASKKINNWVFSEIRKVPVPGPPSSVQVLASREGDCNEHTFLFVALARSAGIPSEVCTGLAYYKGKFYYHSWPKVFAGRWVEMDPALGQTLVDATHIKLIDGGLKQQMSLADIVGNIRLEIVEQE